MAYLTDEMLMAYADGELEAAARTQVEAILIRDAAARGRLAIFMTTGTALAGQFRKPMTEPVPQRLLDTVLGRGEHVATPERPPSLGAMVKRAIEACVSRWPLALACSTVLVLGTGAGWYLHELAGRTATQSNMLAVQQDGRILAQGALRQTLESAPSTARSTTGVGGKVEVRLTFRSRQQEFCRQYEVAVPGGGRFSGIGCRGADGSWQVQLHAPVATRPGADRQIVVVGSDDPAPALIDRLIEGDAFDAADEAAWIGRHWRR